MSNSNSSTKTMSDKLLSFVCSHLLKPQFDYKLHSDRPETPFIEELVDKNDNTASKRQLHIVLKSRLSAIIHELQMTKNNTLPKLSDYVSNHDIEELGHIASMERQNSKTLKCNQLNYL